MALSLTGLVLLGIANLMPFLSLGLEGRTEEASLTTGAVALAQQGLWTLAAVVVITTVVARFLKLGGTFYVLAALRLPRPPSHLSRLFRLLDRLRPWAMVEVYLLGV
ncbi:MAG TPA: paraquat-inducible protein A, partial [Stellaceae bacterium]|nr:paraquat-inducible protein A [Stellaceae bacterium]